MKLTFATYSIFTTLILLIGCNSENKMIVHTENVTAKHTKSPIFVNGLLDENARQDAQILQLRENSTGTAISDNGYSERAFICFDDINLYIAFVCFIERHI